MQRGDAGIGEKGIEGGGVEGSKGSRWRIILVNTQMSTVMNMYIHCM